MQKIEIFFSQSELPNFVWKVLQDSCPHGDLMLGNRSKLHSIQFTYSALKMMKGSQPWEKSELWFQKV